MKERSTSLSYHVSSMKVALSTPPFLMINLTFALLSRFARILKIPCQGVCVYTLEWPISSLQNGVDSHPDIYPPPHKDSSLICDALFYEITQTKTRKMKRIDTILDPFRMIEHPSTCLCYMLYCLTIGKPFNLAYYIANRMVSVTKSADMTLPYGMLLTRLFEHVRINHPYSFSNELYHVDHVMILLSEKRVFRFKHERKRSRLPTPTPLDTESSNSPSLTLHQGVENDPAGTAGSICSKAGSIGTNRTGCAGSIVAIPSFLEFLNPVTTNPSTTFDTTLALTISPPTSIQTTPTLEPLMSPLAPRALTFSTLSNSPLEPHTYLSSLNEIPPRSSNPLPQVISQGLSQTLPQPTLMDIEPTFPPINLSRSRLSAQPNPSMTKEQIQQELNQLHTFYQNIQEAIQSAQHVQESLIPQTPPPFYPITTSTQIPPFRTSLPSSSICVPLDQSLLIEDPPRPQEHTCPHC
nr:hypothetical protein [Tanacetum cinerariifolium]